MVVERLWKLVSEDERAREHAALQRHLEECASCQAYLNGYRLTIHVCKRLHCPLLPERLAQRLLELLEEEQKKSTEQST
jgi:hypothetical protein